MTTTPTTAPPTQPTPPAQPSDPGDPSAAAEQAAAARAARARRRRARLAALVGLLVALLLVLFGWYLLHRDPLPLPGLGQQPLPHYSHSLYGTTRPMGVATSPTGDRVYVTSSDGARNVAVYDRAGHRRGSLTPPAATGAAHVPVYVAVDPTTAEVAVSDRAAQTIYIYDRHGTYQRTLTPPGPTGAHWQPLGLAYDPAGHLYATDVSTTPHRILELTHNGTLIRTIAATEKLSFPNGITIGPAGNIYLADSNNGRLLILSPTGHHLATINRGVADGDLGLPRGTTIDNHNRLYIVDTSSHTIKTYQTATPHQHTQMPTYIGTFGAEGQLDGTFEYPNGITTDTHNHIYITDRENNRVQVWTY